MTTKILNNFYVELTMQDAILENLSNVYFSDKRVTNFSKKLGSDYSMMGSHETWGEEIFTWGQKLPEKVQLHSKDWQYNGYAWGLTDEEGYLYIQGERADLTLTVEGSNMKRVIVYGDRTAKQWATEAYLDGDPDLKIYSDDGVWAIQWAYPSERHSVTFTRWNRAKYPACIIHVRRFGDTLHCGKVTTKRWEWLTQITPRPKEYYYGVTPGRGEVVLWARNELKDYVEDGILTSDMLRVRIRNNDETVVIRSVSDSEYDMNSKLLTLELVDTLAKWDKLHYPGRGLTEETSAFELMAEVLSGLGYTVEDVEKMCIKNIVVGTQGDEMTVAEYLKAIRIPYPYLEPDTYRATIEKFCRLAQLCCYADDNNFPVFVSGRPVMTQEERKRQIPEIPKSHRFGPFKKTVIKKNKVKKVEVEVNEITEEFGKLGEDAYLNNFELEYIDNDKKDYETIGAYNNKNKNDFYNSTDTQRTYIGSVFYACVTKSIRFSFDDKLLKSSEIENANLTCNYNLAKYSSVSEVKRVKTDTKNLTNLKQGVLSDINNENSVAYKLLSHNKNTLTIDFYALSGGDVLINQVLNARLQWKGIKRTISKRLIQFPIVKKA